jgi:RimJ/RimL family protein N-acetyltransferase
MYEHKNGLRLRKIEYDDLKELKELKDESWFGTHKIAIVNMDDQRIWYNKIRRDSSVLVMVAERNKTAIGLYKLSNIDLMNRSCDIGWDIFKKYRGEGEGYRLVESGVDFTFEILNIHRISTEILINNIASRKIVERMSFVLEGTRREAVHKCGEWIDSNFYGILYDDWLQLDRVKAYGGCCNKSYTPKDGK